MRNQVAVGSDTAIDLDFHHLLMRELGFRQDLDGLELALDMAHDILGLVTMSGIALILVAGICIRAVGAVLLVLDDIAAVCCLFNISRRRIRSRLRNLDSLK